MCFLFPHRCSFFFKDAVELIEFHDFRVSQRECKSQFCRSNLKKTIFIWFVGWKSIKGDNSSKQRCVFLSCIFNHVGSCAVMAVVRTWTQFIFVVKAVVYNLDAKQLKSRLSRNQDKKKWRANTHLEMVNPDYDILHHSLEHFLCSPDSALVLSEEFL